MSNRFYLLVWLREVKSRMESLLVQCSWLKSREILVSFTKTVLVGIPRRLLLSVWPSPGSSVTNPFASCTLFSSLSATLYGLPHSLHSPAVLFVAFLWFNLFRAFFVLGYEGQMGMRPNGDEPSSLGHWILILPVEHKMKSYFFYHLWVAWRLRVKQNMTWVGPKVKAHPCFYLGQ